MQQKMRILFPIFCSYLFVHPAHAIQSVQVSIDGQAYGCQAIAARPDPASESKPGPVKRLNENQISFESRIDVSCLKALAGNRNAYPADVILKYAEQCRQRNPSGNNCQSVYSSPQNECLETFQALVSVASHKANQDKILKTCQRIAYHCPLLKDTETVGQ